MEKIKKQLSPSDINILGQLATQETEAAMMKDLNIKPDARWLLAHYRTSQEAQKRGLISTAKSQ